MKISSIISGKKVETIAPDASVHDLVIALDKHKIGALVVSNNGEKIEGIVSERDVVRAMPNKLNEISGLHVRDLMSVNVISCSADANIAEILALMTEKRVRHIPVIENGRLLSIVSIGDLVKAHISEIEGEARALRDYITN